MDGFSPCGNTKGRYKIKSCNSVVTQLESELRDMIEPFNVDNDQFGKILISLTEAITNAIRHGNQYDLSKMVDLEFIPCGDKLMFRVSDEGSGFDANNVCDPTDSINIGRPGGRGVYIIQAFSDKVEFQDNGRTVHMEFDL